MGKVLGISLTLVIVAMLFTGCKSGVAVSNTTSSSPAVTTAKTTATSSTPATSSVAATTSTAAAATSTTPATTSVAPSTSTAAKTTTTVASSTPATSGNDFASIIGKAAGYTTYSCDISMTATTGGTTTSSTGKEWFKLGNPTKFKMELTSGGYTSDIIYDGQYYYTYDPSTKYATKMSVPPSQTTSGSSATQYNPVYISSKTVNGYACSGYTYTASGVLTTMWVSTQYGVVVEFVTPTSTIDYSNFNFSALPDSTFQLPADAILMTIPGMP